MTDRLYRILKKPEHIKSQMLMLEGKAWALRQRQMPSGIDYSKDKVQTTARDQMAEFGSEIDDISRQHKELGIEYAKAINELESFIKANLTDLHRVIVTDRYAYGMKYEAIALHTGYSLSHVKREHHRAISELERRMEERNNEN